MTEFTTVEALRAAAAAGWAFGVRILRLRAVTSEVAPARDEARADELLKVSTS